MDDMIGWLKKEYEQIFDDGSGKMTVRRGKVHTYLGMKLDYTVHGIVKISMLEFLDEILAGFEKEDPHSGGTTTSAQVKLAVRTTTDTMKVVAAIPR
jgi:hypothetical protein